jgi:hypothetical protein
MKSISTAYNWKVPYYHLYFSTATVATSCLPFTLVQLIYQYKYLETPPSMPLLMCCSAVLHGIVWHPKCAYANSRETSNLDSVHNTQNDVTITQTGDRQYGRPSGHVPPCSLFANSKTPARIKFLYNIFKHTVANASGWPYGMLLRYVNFCTYHSWQICIYPKYIFEKANLSALPNFRWLLFIVVNASKTPHPVLRYSVYCCQWY